MTNKLVLIFFTLLAFSSFSNENLSALKGIEKELRCSNEINKSSFSALYDRDGSPKGRFEFIDENGQSFMASESSSYSIDELIEEKTTGSFDLIELEFEASLTIYDSSDQKKILFSGYMNCSLRENIFIYYR